jgi:hypothetical protein
METNEVLFSGYRPRPVKPASTSYALGALAATSVVLCLMGQLWFNTTPADVGGPPALQDIMSSGWTWLGLLLAANGIVFRYTTRPMSRHAGITTWQNLGRSGVLVLALLFHLFFLLLGLFCLVFSGSGVMVGYGST